MECMCLFKLSFSLEFMPRSGTAGSYDSFFFFFSRLLIWLCWVFMAVCRLSLVAVSRGYFVVVVGRLLTAMFSLVVEHGL